MIIEFIGIRTKESFSPGPGEKLHAHRMDLAAFERGALVIHWEYIACGECGKSMARFMRYNLYVVGGAVEVCEYKRS